MEHKGTVTLETERLVLRRFFAEDAEAMFRNWANDSEVTKYLGWQPHSDISVTRAILAEWVLLYQKPSYYHWAIISKELGEPIGFIYAVERDDIKMVQIHYGIGRKWWHCGYTSEAFARLVSFFFEGVGVNRIESWHDLRNPHSGGVLLKCGLKYEGTMCQAETNNQGIYDAARYSILAEDYFVNPLRCPNLQSYLIKI